MRCGQCERWPGVFAATQIAEMRLAVARARAISDNCFDGFVYNCLQWIHFNLTKIDTDAYTRLALAVIRLRIRSISHEWKYHNLYALWIREHLHNAIMRSIRFVRCCWCLHGNTLVFIAKHTHTLWLQNLIKMWRQEITLAPTRMSFRIKTEKASEGKTPTKTEHFCSLFALNRLLCSLANTKNRSIFGIGLCISNFSHTHTHTICDSYSEISSTIWIAFAKTLIMLWTWLNWIVSIDITICGRLPSRRLFSHLHLRRSIVLSATLNVCLMRCIRKATLRSFAAG